KVAIERRNISELDSTIDKLHSLIGLSDDPELNEAIKLRSTLKDCESSLHRAIDSKNAEALSAALKQSDSLNYQSENVIVARKLLSTLQTAFEVRGALNEAYASRNIDALRKALEAAKEKGLTNDPTAVECEKLLTALIERDKLRVILHKS